MPDVLVLLAGLAIAAVLVLLPLWRDRPDGPAIDDELEAARLRHRVALEALRDVEADRRAGSLDDGAYIEQAAQAEERAAVTSRALREHHLGRPADAPGRRRGRMSAVLAAGAIGAALLVGWLVPATGIANETVVNEGLAAAQEAERGRQSRIAALREALAADSSDPDALSSLADAHLAGTSGDDLARAAAALQLLIALEPDRADAYERILAAYLRAGDHANARAALESYASRATADPAEVAFFDGLIALRGESDPDAAVEAFELFLELAPDDPRAPMIRGLRDEAAGG